MLEYWMIMIHVSRWCCPTQPGPGASVGGTTTAGAERDVSGDSADTRNYTTIYTNIYVHICRYIYISKSGRSMES